MLHRVCVAEEVSATEAAASSIAHVESLAPSHSPGPTCQLYAKVSQLSVGPLALKDDLGMVATLQQGPAGRQQDIRGQTST